MLTPRVALPDLYATAVNKLASAYTRAPLLDIYMAVMNMLVGVYPRSVVDRFA